jgi:2-polyprenyl-3-methyl-5-hydroxy-6-metoxy-1,4-benzoquinol methylase
MAGNLDVLTRRLGAKAAQEFVDRLPLARGSRILDVACGTGGATIPLARRGMVVTGLDMVPSLLVQARQNAEREGVSIQFDEGYAEQLPYPDAAFDGVITMFGAMFSPRPEIVAAELARVLKADGLLAMANWNERSFSGQIASIAGRHRKPPPGMVSPLLWGDETTARERLATGFRSIRTEVISIDWELPMGSSEAANFFREHAGHLQILFGQLDERGQMALASELETHWANANIASGTDRHTIIKNEYLQVTGLRR